MTVNLKKFDWSVLDRSNIFDFLWQISSDIINKPLTVSAFHKKIIGHIRSQIPIRFRKVLDPTHQKGHVYVGATYYSDYDQQRKKCIELNLGYQQTEKILKLSQLKYKKICLLIADSILHEIMHMRQYRRRNFKVLPEYNSSAEKTEVRKEQIYLGCSDEIDAYGFNIACELHDKFDGNEHQIIRYLNEKQRGKNRVHNSWRMYLHAFGHDHNHKIIKRLKKKVVHYLPAARRGKPYRNNDWIVGYRQK